MTVEDRSRAALQMERRRTTAMTLGDVSALSELIDEDCRYVHSTGATDDKAGYLAKLEQKAVAYTWIRASEQHVLDLGSAVLVMHRMDAELVIGGVAMDYRSQASAVWRVAPDGTMRLAFFQATALP